MTKSPHPSSVDKGELLPVTVEDLKARGYLVVDARNPLVVSGWIVYLPGVTDHVLIAASEAAAWDMAREHSKQAHSLPGDVGMRALVEEFCLAMEYAAGCNEGVDEGTAASEIMSWAGSPMSVAYTKARAALAPSALSGDAGEGQGVTYDERVEYEGKILALEIENNRLRREIGEKACTCGGASYHPGDEA